jgi:N-acetylmuramic acid 6-phosphate etherase
MVLNMLTTGAMVRMGKTYSNLMVDLRATNTKLTERACRIVAEIAACSTSEANELLDRCDGEVKTAIVVYNTGVSPEAARTRLKSVNGHLRKALESDSSSGMEDQG